MSLHEWLIAQVRYRSSITVTFISINRQQQLGQIGSHGGLVHMVAWFTWWLGLHGGGSCGPSLLGLPCPCCLPSSSTQSARWTRHIVQHLTLHGGMGIGDVELYEKMFTFSPILAIKYYFHPITFLNYFVKLLKG
jgi:hypothetical protein